MDLTNSTELITNLLDLFDKANDYIRQNQSCDMNSLSHFLLNYKGDDWKQYISCCKDCNETCRYKKQLVKNDEFLDMYIITWPAKAESYIHDHPNYGCAMMILDGELVEEEYENNNEVIKFVGTHSSTNSNKKIGFKKGKQLLHKIKNTSDNTTVSLHFYSRGGYKMNVYKNTLI